MAKKGKVGKIINAVVTLVLIGGACVYGFTACQIFRPGNQSPTNQPHTLETPDNFAFDSESYVLTWDDVEHAEGYTIVYNGQNIEVDEGETSHQVLISATENTFKIKANGDGVTYNDSAWSNTISYTIDNSQGQEASLFEKINIELNRAAKSKGYTLEKVIGISFAQTETSIFGNLRVEMLGTKDGKLKNIEQTYKILGKNNIGEILDNINESNALRFKDENIVSYNSAQKFVGSKRYAGEMENLRNQGYEISVIESCVRKGQQSGDQFYFEIVGTYKATNGSDVKYFTSINEVCVRKASSNPINNYENSVKIVKERTITETQFVMHEAGGTLEYMGKLVGAE